MRGGPLKPPPPGRPGAPPPPPGRPAKPPPPPPPGRPGAPPGRPGAPGRPWPPRALGPGSPDWRGIIAGLGRGMLLPPPPPGAGGAAPSARAAGGRGVLRCMPWVDENGLLPGRAPLAGGRGPGVGPGVARAAGAAGLAAGAAGLAAGAEGASAAGAGASRTGSGAGAAGLRGPGTGPGVRVGAAAGAGAASAAGAGAASCAGAGFLAAGLLPPFLAPCARRASPCSSLRRRTTGASTVEEADFTYSPMSFRVDRTTLLSTPNSRASSWTLTATFLLQGGPTPKKDQTTS